jgi:hypothetical protein
MQNATQELMPNATQHPALTDNYLERARKLGQSEARLQAGEPVRTLVQINSLAEFKALVAGHLSDDQRRRHSQDLAQRHAADLAAAGNTFPLARFTDHVYGTAALSAQDRQLAETIFPVTLLAVSQADMMITSDIIYGPSASPVMLNVGRLTFSGGSITALNTVLNVMADALAFGDTPGSKPYHIAFMGVDGAAGANGTAGPTPNPAQATSGADAAPRSPGICGGVGNGGDGSNGAMGASGGNGLTGNNGLPNLAGTLSFGSFVTPNAELVLYTRSGQGGNGGAGGSGGCGQQGGHGGQGCDSGCEGTDGGKAGNGGNGGDGGNGGQGGNGVNGFNIMVTVPSEHVRNVLTSSAVAPYGQGGLAGVGGTGGTAGHPGKGGKGSASGAAGTQGNPGASGKNGVVGTQQGTPGQFFISGN